MRLETIPSATAIILIVLATFQPVASAATPTAVITWPAPGDTILENSTVRINYTGFDRSATSVAGYVTLDGETVATFIRSLPQGPTNGTRSFEFSVGIDAANATSGPHTLTARVFTDVDEPVDTPPRGIVLDKAPTIEVASIAYDLDERRLAVEATVHDDGGAPIVQLRSLGRVVNASFLGTQTMSLDVPVGPGEYNASLLARDGRGQERTTSFRYVVLDRAADLVVDRAEYQIGGKLRVEGNVSDPDRAVRLEIRTPLGSADLTAPNNTTRWALTLNVTPLLGTFVGNVTSIDAWGGKTKVDLTFTIGGPNETFFERTIQTGTGGYADATRIALPPLLGGAITICVDRCDPASSPSNGSRIYSTVCADHEHPLCRQLTGRAGLPGALDLCAASPPPGNLIGQTLWAAVRSVNTAAPPGYGPCSSAFDHVNRTPLERELGLSSAAEGVAVAAVLETNGTARLECATVGQDRQCFFHAPKGAILDLSWLQGPGREVSVRVNGIRV